MDRPPEHLISAQQQELDAERAQRPLVGQREPIDALAHEYARASDVFRGKVAYLCSRYKYVQYVRGDGSCFVRGACVFGLLNWLRTAPVDERARVVGVLQGACARAVAVGYSEIVVEDFFDVLLEEAQRCCAAQPCSEAELVTRLQEKETSDYCVMAMRFFLGSSHTHTFVDVATASLTPRQPPSCWRTRTRLCRLCPMPHPCASTCDRKLSR